MQQSSRPSSSSVGVVNSYKGACILLIFHVLNVVPSVESFVVVGEQGTYCARTVAESTIAYA